MVAFVFGIHGMTAKHHINWCIRQHVENFLLYDVQYAPYTSTSVFSLTQDKKNATATWFGNFKSEFYPRLSITGVHQQMSINGTLYHTPTICTCRREISSSHE